MMFMWVQYRIYLVLEEPQNMQIFICVHITHFQKNRKFAPETLFLNQQK